MTQLNQPTHPTPRRAPAFARSRQRAFTIVEVLVAMGILAIGISSVFTLLPVAAIIQKQAIDAAQGPEFGNSVLSLLKQTMSSNDPAFGTDPSTPVLLFSPLENSYTSASLRYSLNNNLSQLYNYQLVYRRPDANGPVELAILVYRRLPEEEQNASGVALKTITSSYNPGTPDTVYGTNELTPANRGLMKTAAITTAQAIPGNLLLIGNPTGTSSGSYCIARYVGTDTTVTNYGYRIAPMPAYSSAHVIGLTKSPTTTLGTLTCVAIVTGVIQ